MPNKIYTDFIGPMDAGVNSGIEPLLLPKNQLASGTNTSVRGAYVTHRPPYFNRQLIFSGPVDQANFEQGLFQGAGYYRPDYGTEQLIAHISGRLFSLTEVGGAFVVADISIAGDLNDAGQHIVWMWQAEKWLIISDGTGALPIFYDGTSCRRSYGPSIVLGNVTGLSAAVPPDIGDLITATLAANYTGPLNVPVIFNGAFYQTSASVAPGYGAILTNISDVPATTELSGSSLIIKPSVAALISGVSNCTNTLHPAPLNTISLQVDDYSSINIGDTLVCEGISMLISNKFPIGATYFLDGTVVYPPPDFVHSFTIGSELKFLNNTSPNVNIGTTTADFVVPAVGATVPVMLDTAYTGASGIIVWIGNYKYTIEPVVPAVLPPLTVYLVNLTDVSAGYTLPEELLSVPEIPACRMGAYGMGRMAFSHLDGISFDYGDVVGGAAGTQANDYRDSVLKMSESTFLSGGGSFRLPSSGEIITSMIFGANLDTSLGQGPLQVGTDSTIFTCQVGYDRSEWVTTTNPILTEALIGQGPTGQDSTQHVNSDSFFRSEEGSASLVLARRDFNGWGNVPISQEMRTIFEADNQSLLAYGSRASFDNRDITTVTPTQSSQGVYHSGLVSMSFDTVSNLRTKLPPVYDGQWTGLNVLKIITGKVNGTRRCFAFTLDTDAGKIELYELLRQSTTEIMDSGTDRISWTFDTPILFNKDIKPINELIRLANGEIYTKDLSGDVDVEVQYRKDFDPTWTTWHSFTINSTNWMPRIGLGEPSSDDCETIGDRQMRVGYFFQFRFIITGHIKFMGMRVMASGEQEYSFGKPICSDS